LSQLNLSRSLTFHRGLVGPIDRKAPSSSVLFLETSPVQSIAPSYQQKVSPKDHDDILIQLGYVPSNLVTVSARRGEFGTPLALKTYPLDGGASRRKAKARGKLTPFPTLYWFCCPVVGKALADLERRGYVGLLEQKLLEVPNALEIFIRSHEEYAEERWNSLTSNHMQMLENRVGDMNEGMADMIKNSGIAGTDFKSFSPIIGKAEGERIGNPSIKCLHAHYAHYRSQIEGKTITPENKNIVGEWIHEILESEFPDLII
jgi:hypothetical protein